MDSIMLYFTAYECSVVHKGLYWLSNSFKKFLHFKRCLAGRSSYLRPPRYCLCHHIYIIHYKQMFKRNTILNFMVIIYFHGHLRDLLDYLYQNFKLIPPRKGPIKAFIINWTIIIVFRKYWNTTWMKPTNWRSVVITMELIDALYSLNWFHLFFSGIDSWNIDLVFFHVKLHYLTDSNFKSINWKHIKNQRSHTRTQAQAQSCGGNKKNYRFTFLSCALCSFVADWM